MFAIVTHSHQATAEMSLMIDTQQVHTLYVSEQSHLATALSCQNCTDAHDKGSDTHDQHHGNSHGCHFLCQQGI